MADALSRRGFLTRSAVMAGAAALGSGPSFGGVNDMSSTPGYLKAYQETYPSAPRKTAIKWSEQARFGLFMHYGLYSILGRGEWVQLVEKIPVAEYAKLKDQFTAEEFDAGFITDLALAAEMRYVNITSRHHDSFCLFETKETGFNSVDAPAKRDLVAELAEACSKKGLGLFLYYSYAADWKHPYFYPREAGWKSARPAYEERQPEYLYKKTEDFKHYMDFVHKQLRELLTQYGPVAGIWLDPIMGVYGKPSLFPIEETYALIRSLQPQCLISFKQGANGDEDFVAPERKAGVHTSGGELARQVWEKNQGKPKEICNTLQPKWWGYDATWEGQHKTADDVMLMLAEADAQDANLLLNTGPLADGSIHKEDQATLREVGERLRAQEKKA